MNAFQIIVKDFEETLSGKIDAVTKNLEEHKYRFICGEIATLRRAISVVKDAEKKYLESL